MPLIFAFPGHREAILAGIKTVTRRRKVWYREGQVVPAATKFFERPFARLRIERIYRQRLGDMTEEDARREGGHTLDYFRKVVWPAVSRGRPFDPDEEVYVVEFRVV
jgi:hypothetical protein